MSMNPVSHEPVVVQALVPIIVWAAARYGLPGVSDDEALKIAGGAFVVLAPFVRQLVRPVAKDPKATPTLPQVELPTSYMAGGATSGAGPTANLRQRVTGTPVAPDE